MSDQWRNPAGGEWTLGANWSEGAPPAPSEDAVIATPGTFTVSLQHSAAVDALTLASAGAVLAVAPLYPYLGVTLDLAQGLDLESGTLALEGFTTTIPTALGLLPTTLDTFAVLEVGGTIEGSGTLVGSEDVIAAQGSVSVSGGAAFLGQGSTLDGEAGGFTIGAAASWTVSGAGEVITGALVNEGSLVLGGTVDFNPAGEAPLDNTGTLVIAPGAEVTGTLSALDNAGTIDVAGQATLDVSGAFTNTGNIVLLPGGTLDLILPALPSGGIGTVTEAGGLIIVDPPGGGAADAVACYTEGTRLLTEDGEVPVEALRVGQRLVTFSGESLPIIWIGERTLSLAPGDPEGLSFQPVRLRAEALAPGVPRCDLLLSPDHALAFRTESGWALIPARFLLNGLTITQERRERVRYFHVELPRHTVVFAEGAMAETYLDTGNRSDFSAFDIASGHPGFGRRSPAEAWAPLLLGGPALTRIRRRLYARARLLGWRPRREGALWLERGERREYPQRREGERYRFLLPPGPAEIVLASTAAVPLEDDPAALDLRLLGAQVRAVVVGGVSVALDSEAFGPGFHRIEGEGTGRWRWSDGRGVLRLGSAPEPVCLDVVVSALQPGYDPPPAGGGK
jgi:hypothetical protein